MELYLDGCCHVSHPDPGPSRSLRSGKRLRSLFAGQGLHHLSKMMFCLQNQGPDINYTMYSTQGPCLGQWTCTPKLRCGSIRTGGPIHDNPSTHTHTFPVGCGEQDGPWRARMLKLKLLMEEVQIVQKR